MKPYSPLMTIFLLSLATSTVSVTITKAKIFSLLRMHVSTKSKKLGELFHCPYCMSHWVGMFFFLFYTPYVVDQCLVIDFAVSFFVLVALATFSSLGICKALEVMDRM